MARDSQAALVALNRFGLGARGDASGDFVNAASDPRGFVKAELDRPNGALLEVPGLQSTPALAQTVFAYQFEIVQARNAAAKSAAPKPEAGPAAEPVRPQNGATDIAGKAAAMEATDANAAMAPARRCNRTRRSRRRSRPISSRKPTAPRRWRGCSAR